MVGLIPLFAVGILEPETLKQLPNFKKRLEWFIKNRPDLRRNVACMEAQGVGARRLLAIVSKDKLQRILQKMLDEDANVRGSCDRIIATNYSNFLEKSRRKSSGLWGN
jgi:hypothetical protein